VEFAPLLAGFNPLEPIVVLLQNLLGHIDAVTHNIGWSLVLLAALISGALWPLRDKQFKSAAAMQQIQPEVKALQARFKGDPQKLNTATMELYKERGVNPLASCLPLVLQMPILFSVYQAINGNRDRFNDAGFLWIGSSLSHAVPFLATSLVYPDYVLLVLYIVSMFFSFKLTAPVADPAQAKQQQIMAFISPAMIGFFAIQNKWPSALIVYWLSTNVFSMAQQLLMMRRRPKTALATSATVVDVPVAKAAKGMRGPAPAVAKKLAPQAGGTGGTGGKSGKGSGTNAAAKRRR